MDKTKHSILKYYFENSHETAHVDFEYTICDLLWLNFSGFIMQRYPGKTETVIDNFCLTDKGSNFGMAEWPINLTSITDIIARDGEIVVYTFFMHLKVLYNARTVVTSLDDEFLKDHRFFYITHDEQKAKAMWLHFALSEKIPMEKQFSHFKR